MKKLYTVFLIGLMQKATIIALLERWLNFEVNKNRAYARGLIFFFLLVNAVFGKANVIPATNKKTKSAITKEQIHSWVSAQPVRFLENKGQMMDVNKDPVPFVLFKASAPGMDAYITEKGLTYVFVKTEEKEKRHQQSGSQLEMEGEGMEMKEYEMAWINLSLENASIKKENIVKEGESAEHFNYFYGHCPNGINDVHEYEKITIKEVYPGIDWVFYSSSKTGMKYDFLVHPGADPNQIRLIYESEKPLKADKEGNLHIKTKLGELTENAPFTYVGDSRQEISSCYKISSQEKRGKHYLTRVAYTLNSTFSFQQSLVVIDPQLVWGTLYGGNGNDGFQSICNDGTGNVFVTGYTASTDFPTQNSAVFFQGTFFGAGDAFILKVDNAGHRIWATYYGGTAGDQGNSIATDGFGNVFVTGGTAATDFPTQNSGTFFQGTNAGGGVDVFILKFDNAGNRLWATYYGGSGDDQGYSIVTNGNGNVFVTGSTTSLNFPTQNSGTFFQGTYAGAGDALILKFDNAGNRLWATYYGGSGSDQGNSIAPDGSGNLFITGFTASTDFPTQNAGTFFQGTNGGGVDDIFILKFDSTCNRLWATYYGGSGTDKGNSLATDGSGNIFITGTTTSTDFPTQNAGTFFQGTYGGGNGDVFILKFDNACNRLWATYYGGNAWDYQHEYDNLAIDGNGNIYMSFATSSTVITTLNPGSCYYFDGTFGGGAMDCFITQFTNTGTLLWASYIGGDHADFRVPLTVDNNNNFFMGGEFNSYINSSTLPMIDIGGGAYYDDTPNGMDDSYILKFIPCSSTILSATTSSTTILCNGQCTGTGMANPTGGTPPYTYSWNTIPIQTSQTATGLCVGTYTVTVTDSVSSTTTATVFITQLPDITGSLSTTPAICGSDNGSATVNAAGGTPGYTYSWAPSGGTAATATNLASGTYTVTITDANMCADTSIATISSTGGATVAITSQTTVLCFGDSTGSVTASANGGSSPYDYVWTGASGTLQTTNNVTVPNTINNLAAGTYTVTVTDNNSCTSTSTVIITQPISAVSATISGTTPTICGSASGTTTVTATGGTPGYTYNWAPSGGTTATATNLAAGTYTVTITDANMCTATAIATVNSSGGATVAITSQTSVLCFGGTTGSATASASSGSSPYDYVWTSVSGTLQTTNNVTIPDTINGLVAGSYTVTVTDNNACISTATVIITQPLAGITATVSTIPSNCGSNDGSATVTASGGTGSLTYSWTGGGSTNPSITNVGSGTYTVTVTDSNACTQTATGVITSLGGPIASAGTDVIIVSGSSTSLSASGAGTGGTYSWTPASGLSCSTCANPIASPSTTTDYCVTVTNAGGCADSACVRVIVELPCPDDFSVPNAFSSNNDGHNDVFELKGWNNCVVEFSIVIFDRWGEKVFESTNASKSWDGTYKGKPMGSAVFVYYIKATLIGGEKITKKGNVSLIR